MTAGVYLTRRQVRERVYLSGVFGNYQVHHNIQGEASIIYVPNASMGHEIVRALRQRAYRRYRSGRPLNQEAI